ncbi:hypothetical protein SAGEFAYGE_22 [Bacillus phage SageFayge]|uniref:Uncharacterized protein n=1 Tax=Bacillus phage SageFayge TaxID=1805954 RepID=A0A143FP19_9CAUD|nr:hypothetical protein BI007_gp017 [Bacillus phage DIGNKC]YP_009280825.1 hypothetical protein SAGEFAYGE_22 [Bacillus phage SageFayge]AMW62909.1 hypothetical protein DIGNKC_17 [Bacillus phage DIGNKC]AMW62943.1 hypothetical protein SAGEFAYGE_22 [Bacillus phage SageFayge]
MEVVHVKDVILGQFEAGATYDIRVQDEKTGKMEDLLDVLVHQVCEDYLVIQEVTGETKNLYWVVIIMFIYKGVNSGVVH